MFEELKGQVIQDLNYSIPGIIVSVGDISDDCKNLMNKLSESSLIIDCSNIPPLDQACVENQLPKPSLVSIHLFNAGSPTKIDELQYRFSFIPSRFYSRAYFILTFIDYSHFSDFEAAKDLLFQIDGANPELVYFIIYKAPIELTSLSEDSHVIISFSNYSETLAYSMIRENLSRISANALIRFIQFAFAQDSSNKDLSKIPKIPSYQSSDKFPSVDQPLNNLNTLNNLNNNSMDFSDASETSESKNLKILNSPSEKVPRKNRPIIPKITNESNLPKITHRRTLSLGTDTNDIEVSRNTAKFQYYAITGQLQDASKYGRILIDTFEARKEPLPLWSATVHESIGMLELEHPDFTRTARLQPSADPFGSPWLPESAAEALGSPIIQFLASAASLFASVHEDNSAIDCGLRCLLLNSPESKLIIEPLFNKLISFCKNDGMVLRCWDFLQIFYRINKLRHAVIYATKFANAFRNSDKFLSKKFIVFAISLLSKDVHSNSILLIRNLCLPLIQQIHESDRIPDPIVISVSRKIIEKVGPQLTQVQQDILFNEATKQCTSEIFYPFVLPLSISSYSFHQNSLQIIPNSNYNISTSSIFIYSFIKSSSQNYASANSKISFSCSVFNPLLISIQARYSPIFSFTSNDQDDINDHDDTNEDHDTNDHNKFVEYEESDIYLEKKKETKVYPWLKVKKAGKLEIKGIQIKMRDNEANLEFEEPILLDIVETAPTFDIRTDLPLSSELDLIDGESFPFTVWFFNSSSKTICFGYNNNNVELLDSLPILSPGQRGTSHFSYRASQSIKLLELCFISKFYTKNDINNNENEENNNNNNEIRNNNENNENDDDENDKIACAYSIKQPIKNNTGLVISRMFSLANHEIINNSSNSDIQYSKSMNFQSDNTISIAFEIKNESISTFNFTSSFCNEISKGVIGPQESTLLISQIQREEFEKPIKLKPQIMVEGTKRAEERLGKRLTSEERDRVFKELTVLEIIKEKWNFSWTISSIRKGSLIIPIMTIDDDLYDMISSKPISIDLKWRCCNSENKEEYFDLAKNLPVDEKLELKIDLGENMKQLELIPLHQTFQSMIWNGSLSKKISNQKSSSFIICFISPGTFFLKIKYVLNTDIVGESSFTLNVQE